VIAPRTQEREPDVVSGRRRPDTKELPSRVAATRRRAMQAAMTAAVFAMQSSGRRPVPPARQGATPRGGA
jgi:hypothetical protein